MAELVITANSVIASGTFSKVIGQAGAAITAGQVVYQKASDSKYYLAQSDGTAEESGSGVTLGIALGAAGAASQYFVLLTSGTYTVGATVVAGTTYYVTTTAGSMGGFADVSTGGTNYLTIVGIATTTAIINVAFNATGILKA